jgi:hypothetical protein
MLTSSLSMLRHRTAVAGLFALIALTATPANAAGSEHGERQAKSSTKATVTPGIVDSFAPQMRPA